MRAGLVLAATALLIEAGMRLLLFRDVPGLGGVSARLREPGNFCEKSDPDYFKLVAMLTPAESLRPIPVYDPVLGWKGHRFVDGTYELEVEKLLDDRRPVVLYGDSFADCAGTSRSDCWEGLLNRSELKAEHALLNFGVGGYGTGQIYLLFRETIDRLADRDPIVIVGIFIEDDLDRAVLGFRAWPKPRVELVDGVLVAEPVIEGVEEYLDAQPPEIESYAWRYLVHGTSLLPGPRVDRERERERVLEKMELNRAILRAIRDELEGRGLDWFFLLYYGQGAIRAKGSRSWRHDFLLETMAELEAPFVTTLRPLLKDRFATGRSAGDYFVQEGATRGHYNELGNRVAFQAILDGIAGRFEEPPAEPAPATDGR